MTTVVIAEDEPLLAEELKQQLLTLWPELQIVAIATDGEQAVTDALNYLPDLLFLDIRMPQLSGIEAASQIIAGWPQDKPLGLITFVTAYDQYAVQAFETNAIDYLLKPVTQERLATTKVKLQHSLEQRSNNPAVTLKQLKPLLQQLIGNKPTTIQFLQASLGNNLHIVPISEVVLLRADNKYLRVITYDGKEQLIRTPLSQLIKQLDENEFWQIHRSTVVRASEIASVTRSDTGRLRLKIKNIDILLAVSRQFSWRFKAM